VDAAAILAAGVTAGAQWLHQPMANAPRTRDGKVNMTGPVPRLDGKPDLSGIWQVPGDPRAPGGCSGSASRSTRSTSATSCPTSRIDQRPLTTEGAERLRRNGVPGVFNPVLNCLPDSVVHGDLLPEPFKFIHSRGVS
jgi:hypothetical protein